MCHTSDRFHTGHTGQAHGRVQIDTTKKFTHRRQSFYIYILMFCNTGPQYKREG